MVAPRDGLLDDLALALDVQSKCLANWRKLAQKLGVEQQVLKQLERRSTESPANKLFEYLRATSPQMKLKTLKESLGMMKRNDVLRILQERNLDGRFFNKQSTGSLSLLYLLNNNCYNSGRVRMNK